LSVLQKTAFLEKRLSKAKRRSGKRIFCNPTSRRGYDIALTTGRFMGGAYNHKSVSTTELSTLSALQKKLLKAGLMAHYRKGADTVFRAGDPGCFSIVRMMKEIEDRRVRHVRRAAAGRAIARLIRRGLLESCARGAWRLTPRGFKAARDLWPEIRRPGEHELAVAVAAWMDERPTLISGIRLKRAIRPGIHSGAGSTGNTNNAGSGPSTLLDCLEADSNAAGDIVG
jgi:hypothetical protein